MFDYIKGILIEANFHKAVIEANGIGYRLFIPASVYTKLPSLGEEVLFYIATIIREDSHRNFGFLLKEERDRFVSFSDISGIGPKTALALIGHLEEGELVDAITTANIPLLSKVPGVGKKTAERLIVEMRDKLDTPSSALLPKKCMTNQDRMVHDATSALIQLGYNTLQAQRAVKKSLPKLGKKEDVSALIAIALKGV